MASTGLTGWRLRHVQAALLEWYRANARSLRIRSTREPWAVLVAEVMAQQTQIARVDETWAIFVARFPTPRALAEASPADVLRAWSGLGHNRRAIGLQRAARVIEAEHGGRVPCSVAELERLPGVGPYTARAVAALAFGRPVAAVDTNARRLISRLIGRTLTPRELQESADDLVATDDAATWNHAVMELGATLCRPARPDCPSCPLSRWCASAGRLDEAPRRAARPGSSRSTRPVPVPFERTTRWLRGRVVARLREVGDGAWTRLPASMGTHGADEIAAAVSALESEGILERSADGAVRLPSRPS